MRTTHLSIFKFILLSITACFAVSGQAGQTENLTQAEQALVAHIQSVMQKSETLKGRFEQKKTLQGVPFALMSAGNFKIENSNYLLWNITSPIKSQLEINVADGKFVMDHQSYDVDSGQATAMRVVGEIIVAVFTSDWNTLQQYFSIHGEAPTGSPAEVMQPWQVQLTPKSEALAQVLREVKLRGREYIEHVSIIEKQSDMTEIRFFDFSPAADAQKEVTTP